MRTWRANSSTTYAGPVIFLVALAALVRTFSHGSVLFTTRAHVGVVVSFCREPLESIASLRSLTVKLEAAGLKVDTLYYCKCVSRPWCTMMIPNIGREGQTFLWHVFQTYKTLHHVTIFVNGGFLSKPHTTAALTDMVDHLLKNPILQSRQPRINLATTLLDDFYSDGGAFTWEKPNQVVGTVKNCSVVSEFCAVQANLCDIADLPCVGTERCGCTAQRTCNWVGASKENPTTAGGALQPALSDGDAPHSIYSWACDILGISPNKIRECGYTWGATFAVGRNRLKRLPASDYEKLLVEFEKYGTNGGIMVHYMERLWRSIYLC